MLSILVSLEAGAERRDQAKETDLGGRSNEKCIVCRIEVAQITRGPRGPGLRKAGAAGGMFEAT